MGRHILLLEFHVGPMTGMRKVGGKFYLGLGSKGGLDAKEGAPTIPQDFLFSGLTRAHEG